ncbi:MAG: CheR family methyltransferase [Ktedonobacteraceae bacterium]
MGNNGQKITGPGDLVVVGSSAGGIEALSILVSTLPVDFPAPIVLAQHLDPSRPSSLDSILQRRTQLPVEVVSVNSQLEAGKIYVVPSNRHVAITNGHVSIQGDHAKRPRPSVDLLLTSAAGIYGERLIAVILTGSGSDGAAGAIEVKSQGGTVIVQNPQTARYPSMPLALPPTVIDVEADIEQIGPILYDLLMGTKVPEPEERTENVLHSILERINHQASVDFRPYKTSTILRRIGRRMTVTHCKTMHDYLEYLRVHPDEVGELVKAFLINVTQFFRDMDAFMYLKNEILPRLIEQARSQDRVLRFWTAGCSTGEEPYSLAMLLTEALDMELPDWNIKVFATDVDESAITFARRGIYSENLLKNVPPEYRERFFERVDHGYRIEKSLRQMVIFGHQDLSRSAPFPRIDLVMCRNVLIYFTPELQNYVLNQFAFSLGNDGFLFLGKAETVRPNQSYYELINKSWKVYHCKGNALGLAHRQNVSERRMLQVERQNGSSYKAMKNGPTDAEPPPLALELGQLRHFSELLLRFLPVGVIVIDRNYHIITANGAGRRLLGMRDITNDQDFLHSARGIPYTEVRNAIDAVFRERTTVTLPEVELDSVAAGGTHRFVFLSIVLMQFEPGTPDVAAISVTDVTEQVQTQRQLEAAQAEQSQLMGELATANKRLNDVNKELLDANEELQVANEELVLTHEELQATIEEFETTNEELQATNEELETSNEELQATNEELETTNDELRARTGELQEMSNMLESERVRLAEMVELAPFYIIVLRGPELIVEAYNPRYAELLAEHLAPGKTLEEAFGAYSEVGQIVTGTAREVYTRDIVLSTPRTFPSFSEMSEEYTGQNFVHTIVPSHDALGKVTGVIIYSIDETEQRAQEIEEESRKLKLIFDHSDITALALYDAQTSELMLGSPRYLDIVASLHRLDRNQLIGGKWQELTMVIQDNSQPSPWDTLLTTREVQRLPELHLHLTPDGPESIWVWTLTPISSVNQEGVRYILVSAIEISEQVHIREEVEQLNQLKDDFISLASHELRTPLTAIMGNTEIMQRNLLRLVQGANGASETTVGRNVLEQQQHTVESILHQSLRLNKLIDEMLDIARVQGKQLELQRQEHVQLVALVRRAIENQATISHRRITLETNAEEVSGTWDDARIEQVINNLLSNAIKYSPVDDPVTVNIERTASEAVVSVRDHGKGIGEEQQDHIFERYYRARTDINHGVEGLGLGLYIAHEIIHLHGGRMWLESHRGEGSTFYLSLPL